MRAPSTAASWYSPGLVTIGHDAEGPETWALTSAGEEVANQIAMSAEDDGVALLTALLDAREAP